MLGGIDIAQRAFQSYYIINIMQHKTESYKRLIIDAEKLVRFFSLIPLKERI